MKHAGWYLPNHDMAEVENFYPNDLDAVLLMIRQFARENGLTPQQVGEIFTDGVALHVEPRWYL